MPQKEISIMVILFCLYNARGRVLAGAKISDNVMPGVVVLSTGAWFDPDYDLNIEMTWQSLMYSLKMLELHL